MVKPTSSSDAISSSNRFAILGAATSDSQNPLTLAYVAESAGAGNCSNNNKGAISKNSGIVNVENRVSRLIPGLHIGGKKQGKQQLIRDRSNSTKRKNSAENSSNAKSPRLDAADCPHLKVIEETKGVISKVLESMTAYSGNDPVLANNIYALASCMNSFGDILGTVMAERLIPGKSPDEISGDEDCEEVSEQSSTFLFPPPVASRKPLKQQPLGNTESWATAVSRNTKRSQQVKKTHANQPETPVLLKEKNNPTSGIPENPFNKAVKEAERSLLIFNLDLGKSPIMNPTTISARVTVSLLNTYIAKQGSASGNHTQDARDLVDDITSQVKSMEFFGSKTGPCKFPKDSSRDGEFHTVPVKMVFKDRRTAQTAAELLRKYMGINTTTPYHRTLRAAITQAINRAKDANPGHHAKVNLDMNGKSLKCFIRTDSNPPGKWSQWGNNIRLPSEALDPGMKDPTKVILPTSPNCPSIAGFSRSQVGETAAVGSAGKKGAEGGENSDSDSCMEEESRVPTAEEIRKQQEKVNSTLSPLPQFMNTPKNKSFFAGRSGLITRTPPGSDNDRRSSFGS
jgi:hypothetical protein